MKFCRTGNIQSLFLAKRLIYDEVRKPATLDFGSPPEAKNEHPPQQAPAITMPFEFAEPKPEEGKDKKLADNEGMAIPERPKDALSGSQFIEKLKTMEDQLRAEGKSTNEIRKRREEEVYNQLRSGNIPPHLRDLKNVQVEMKDENGQNITGTIRVMPDYIAIGDEKDNVRVPMTPATAQLLANQWGCSMPTTKMVDQIYRQAKQNGITLKPHPKPPGAIMMTTDYFEQHDKAVDAQLMGFAAGNPSIMEGNPLITGDKKDIVLPYHGEGGRNVIIYGWYDYRTGKPIQGYSGGAHENTYADYSHGVRMVAGNMVVRYPDGRTETRSVDSVMSDPKLYPLISQARIADSRNAYPDNAWTRNFDRSPPPAQPAAQPEAQPAAQPEEIARNNPPATSSPTPLPPLDFGGVSQTTPAPLSSPGEPSGGETVPASVRTVPSQPSEKGNADLAPSGPVTADQLAQPLRPYSPSAHSRTSAPSNQPGQPPSAPGAVTQPAPYSQPAAQPAPAPDQVEPQQPSGPAEQPAGPSEQREKGPVKGSVLICGDSISVNMDKQKAIECTGQKESVAVGGKTSKWLLGWLNGEITSEKGKELPSPKTVKDFDYVVVLIGTNDIGTADLADWSETAIFKRIEKIWQKLREINPNIKIYAVTIPPFKGYSFGRYGREFEIINQRRKDINGMIMASSLPYGKIDICRQYNPDDPGAGGVTTSDDPDQGALDDRAKNDKVHPRGNILAQIYQRALASEAKVYPPPGNGQEQAQNEPPPSPGDQPPASPQPGVEQQPGSEDLFEVPINSPILDDPSQIRRATTVDPREGKGIVGDEDHQVYPPPDGYKRVGKVPSAAVKYVVNRLPDWRHTPVNTTVHFVAGGREYMARIEWHQNKKDPSSFLQNPHHGWSVFPKNNDGAIDA